MPGPIQSRDSKWPPLGAEKERRPRQLARALGLGEIGRAGWALDPKLCHQKRSQGIGSLEASSEALVVLSLLLHPAGPLLATALAILRRCAR